jgi:hypothetical protein
MFVLPLTNICHPFASDRRELQLTFPVNPYPFPNDYGPYHEQSLTCCIVCWKVHPMPSACVSDNTTNNRSHMPNDRLALNFTRTFVTYLRNVGQMTKSSIFFSYKYPLPYVSRHHFFSIHLIYRTYWLDENSRVRR